MIKVLVFLVAFHLLVHKDIDVKAEYAPFDFFKLTLQWPSSLCKLKPGCKRPPPDDFTIHGLWPNNFKGADLKKCYYKPYNTSLMIDELVQKLLIHWPDIKGAKEQRYWTHEWHFHGVCSLLWYNQPQYFNLAVLRKQAWSGLKTFMINKGIVPGFNMSYTYNEYWNAVKEYTTKDPDFSCGYDQYKNYQLSSVRLCLTPGGDIMDCPADRNSASCSFHDYINFPLL